MRKLFKAAVVVGIAIALMALQACSPDRANRDTETVSVFILVDSSHPVYRYTYCVYGDTIFLQRCVFPGYSDPKQYSIKPSPEMLSSIRTIAGKKGDSSPPFEPEQLVHCSIEITLTLDGKRKTRIDKFFLKDNEFAEALLDLRKSMEKQEYEIGEIPAIIRDSEALAEFFPAAPGRSDR